MQKVKVKNLSEQILVYYEGGVRKQIMPGEEATVPVSLLKVFSGKIVKVAGDKKK